MTGSLSSEEGKIKSLWLKGDKAHTVDTRNSILKSEAMHEECWDCLAFSPNLAPRKSTAKHESSRQKFSLSGESDKPKRKL